MLSNANIWLGVISLARELIKYLREKDTCPIVQKSKAKEAAKALKDKDTQLFKDKINEMLD